MEVNSGGSNVIIEPNALVHFEVFRYQLLPRTQVVQKDLFDDPALSGITTVDELKRRKNELFERVLGDFPPITHRQRVTNHRVDMLDPPWFVLELNTQKSLQRDMRDFKQERLDTWPQVVIIINNDPTVQLIAISRNQKAFSSGKVVAKALEDGLGRALERYQLSVSIEALFDRADFWSLVRDNQGRIVSVKFELVSPNMANISKSLKLDLAALNAATNSNQTDLKLNAASDGALEINPENPTINSLVDYASDGCGDIVVKIRGLKSLIRTSHAVREISIDELSIKNLKKETLESLFGQIK